MCLHIYLHLYINCCTCVYMFKYVYTHLWKQLCAASCSWYPWRQYKHHSQTRFQPVGQTPVRGGEHHKCTVEELNSMTQLKEKFVEKRKPSKQEVNVFNFEAVCKDNSPHQRCEAHPHFHQSHRSERLWDRGVHQSQRGAGPEGVIVVSLEKIIMFSLSRLCPLPRGFWMSNISKKGPLSWLFIHREFYLCLFLCFLF